MISDTINSMRTNLGNAYDELENKGATIPTNKNIENLANAIASISASGGSEYQRPSDWLEIPTMGGTKDDIYILNGVSTNGINKLYFKISGTGTIDWGDGNVESFTGVSITTFEHSFTYSDLSDSSFTTHNNTKQALVHIQGDRGAITYFSTAGIQYKYVNEDGITINLNYNISTDVYQISANVQSCKVYCSNNASVQKHKKMEIFDWVGTITTTNMEQMFFGCNKLTSIPHLDTSNATTMFYMFQGCYSLTTIPQLDTSNVTNMSNMFYLCDSLKTIPQLDTKNVINMERMFGNCRSLKTIPLLDTSNVTNMREMFNDCYSLTTIPQLDTKNVILMANMLSSCPCLTTIPQLNTSNATSIGGMVDYSYSVKVIPQLDASKANGFGSNSGNYTLKNIRLYNGGAGTQSSITIANLTNSTTMSKQDLVDLFNSLAINPTNETKTYTRKIQLGTTLQGYLAECYVKDSGQLYTAILPTSDTEVDSTKTYYTYDNASDTYTQFSGATFDAGTQYYELKTATWNRYDICNSTDDGAVLALSWLTDTKGWTVS